MKFVMIYGASGVGKESVARELAARNGWKLFPQHLAFDVACAVIGFGNAGFEKYQRKICLDAFRTMFETQKDKGIVFTFCYVNPASNFFIEGLLDLLQEFSVCSDFVYLSCDYDEHLRRVLSDERKNTNKLQSKQYLDKYLKKFDFSATIPNVESIRLATSNLTIEQSATEIESYLKNK
ncbi:hypothetical protein DXX93_09610 [Thalassotalea euphylliae]|uniref:AAA family ATPase n=1 Tax=Thalassotalea euphylliae TaxID=1655234 RepID=A0A3E0TQL3_9GAMM|nr:AAA family ATPase [Thalassotalea euphylliae]REL26804.1 hypothetical protein DXX93_09610 [Thalassotalea euphylliae]